MQYDESVKHPGRRLFSEKRLWLQNHCGISLICAFRFYFEGGEVFIDAVLNSYYAVSKDNMIHEK